MKLITHFHLVPMLRMRGATPPSLHKHLYNLTLKTMQLTLMYWYVKLHHAWRPPGNKRCKTGDTNCSTTDCKFQASSFQHVIISSAFFLILHAAPTLLNPSLQEYLLAFFFFEWAGKLSRYSDWLLAGRSGDLFPVGARFSAPLQTGPGYNGYRVFPGGKEPDDPDKKGYPGVPSWGFGVGLTPSNKKKTYCYESRAKAG